LEEKLKMFEKALKELIASMKEKEEVPVEVLERIDRIEKKVDLLTRILTEWLPAKFSEEMKNIGISTSIASSQPKTVVPQLSPETPMTPVETAKPTVEPSLPSLSSTLRDELDMLREELATIERQLADLEFQKDSGFITTTEYEKKKRELEAKKREIELRIKGK